MSYLHHILHPRGCLAHCTGLPCVTTIKHECRSCMSILHFRPSCELVWGDGRGSQCCVFATNLTLPLHSRADHITSLHIAANHMTSYSITSRHITSPPLTHHGHQQKENSRGTSWRLVRAKSLVWAADRWMALRTVCRSVIAGEACAPLLEKVGRGRGGAFFFEAKVCPRAKGQLSA